MDRSKKMMGYLPVYWHDNEEMKEILKAHADELDLLHADSQKILTDAFLSTMGESRIAQWESRLNLPPTGTLEERRLRVMRYFGVISKLNESAIKVLVASFHNDARAFVKFVDSTIKIVVVPLPEHFTDELDFTALLNEISIRKPCHIGVTAERGYCYWSDVKDNLQSWGNVRSKFKNWEEVLMYIPR